VEGCASVMNTIGWDRMGLAGHVDSVVVQHTSHLLLAHTRVMGSWRLWPPAADVRGAATRRSCVTSVMSHGTGGLADAGFAGSRVWRLELDLAQLANVIRGHPRSSGRYPGAVRGI